MHIKVHETQYGTSVGRIELRQRQGWMKLHNNGSMILLYKNVDDMREQ
jgi:hypothetical protein